MTQRGGSHQILVGWLKYPPHGIVRQAIAEALQNVQIVAAQQGIKFNSNQTEEAFGNQLDQLLDRFG